VQRFHEAVLAAGGEGNGAPGGRDYHPGYYSVYAFEPRREHLEAVFHGPSKLSAPSVVIEAA
jgi:lactoylglutathione lyase